MQALLGKISSITPKNEATASGRSFTRLEVKFKAACVLPQRTKLPEWLKDQTLTLEREVIDPREVGAPGDSLVLTPAESARWLYPLAVAPVVTYGELPRTLQLQLRWWKDEKPPEFTVRANGRTQSASFVKEGDAMTASVETSAFFDAPPALPVAFEVTCEKMRAACTVLPAEEPGARKLVLPEGERYRLESAWYAVDLTMGSDAGGIFALREKGRGIDHFRRPEERIQHALEYAGHRDRFRTQWDWSNQVRDARVTCSGARREGAATRLDLEGVVDEGQNLRTSVAYTLYDGLPLLLLQRDYRFGKGKEPEGKEKEEKPKEPIDEMKAIGLGFRAAWTAERNGRTGSRVLCADGERLVASRCAEVGEGIWSRHWRMAGGWAIVEHPARQEHTLYLSDPQTRPQLGTWLSAHTITLEPRWPSVPVRPEESLGYTLALTAGERCGAAAEGGWVACRTRAPEGGVRCGVIARLRHSAAPATAIFVLGGERQEAPLDRMILPGLGEIYCAAVTFPAGQMEDAFDVTAAGIGSRR